MDRADNRPPYARIAGHYRDLIESGALSPGTLLPSIKALSEQWSVSTATVEKALRKLREEQLVRGIHGIGTEVIGVRVPISSGAERHDRSSRTQSSWGTGEKSSGHTAGIVPVPADVAGVFGISPGEDVIRRSRVYRDAHGIVSHSTSWIPAEFGQAVPDLARSERLKGGLSLDLISRATGRQVVQRVDDEGARIATAEDLELLELQPDMVAAILVLTALFLDADGELLEYGVDLGAPGRTRRTTSEVLR
ncbi:GntR family transcriptional regulator [Streptomyces sp. CB02488]|uniref:GntR family transcriptional regulator n=1 Tax=Streptomyces sp. CB02488 TaxID=1703920 RepID=UPI00094050B2|nr:GntR family transcriptional regulator [Streptomyces sp. CB02488]OKK05278.1 GntR family transcriptional regulator [Streptomyces sp. CB02488]